ncbi:MAG TPA: SLC13 family permease [Bacillus sp. (in: firmicutes)]|nr:SLC13 family permease [Bacillus sp. (in: firmicutes)]
MSIELFAIIVLLMMFIIGSILPINIGIMGFVAAFLVGSLISGMSLDDIFAVFPADLFITLAGVTYLFSIVQNNGTIDLLTSWGLRLVRGNLGLMPWVMFALSTLLASIGTLGPATVAIFAPVALGFAARYNISPLLMGIMVANGAVAGYYSPLNPVGVIVNGVMHSRDIPHSPGMLYVNGLIFTIVVSGIIFLLLGGLRLLRKQTSAQGYVASAIEESGPNRPESELTFHKAATLAGLILLVVLALGFDLNIGFAAFTVGLLLALIAPKQQTAALKLMPWSVILLITGIVTYVGVLEELGIIDYMTEQIAKVGNPVIAALAASYVGGIVSSFASTVGFLAAIIPLAAPILQDPAMSSIGVISAIAIASGIVDLSPFSTSGALLVANVKGMEERVFIKKLLIVTIGVVALGPGLAWLMFVLL